MIFIKKGMNLKLVGAGMKKVLIICLAILLIVIQFLDTKKSQAVSPWYDYSWKYRKEIIIDNSGGGALSNYSVKVTLNNTNFDFSKALSDGRDIRFTDNNAITVITHWIESYDSVGQTAVIWAKVPSVLAGQSKTVYMYYGNSSNFDAYDYFKFTVDSTTHNNYGLAYPITYKFSIPAGSSGLKAYKKYTLGSSWAQITEKTSSDFFNGIEVARFDYGDNKAYLSVAFDASSDDIYLKITDSSGFTVESSFLEITKYYDNRDAAVVISGDDWTKDAPPGPPGSTHHTAFVNASNVLRARNIWFTAGIITDYSDSTLEEHPVWNDVQPLIDAGYLEIASHSATHIHTPYLDPVAEIDGSKQTLINNLDLPFKKGSTEYLYAYLGPFGEGYNYITQLNTSKYLNFRAAGVAIEDDFDYRGRIPNLAYGSMWLDGSDLTTANNKFDSVVAAGGVYHAMLHPASYNWSTGWQLQHFDYIKEKTNLWYVGLGYMYLYEYPLSYGKISSEKTLDDKITVTYPELTDNFPGASLNSNIWSAQNIDGNGTVTVSGGTCILDPENNVINSSTITSKQDGFNRAKVRLKTTAISSNVWIGLSIGQGLPVVLGAAIPAQYYSFYNGYIFRIKTNTDSKIFRFDNGTFTEIAAHTGALDITNFHDYEMTLSDSGVRVYRDGVQILSSADTTYSDGNVKISGGAYSDGSGDTTVVETADLYKQYTSPAPSTTVGSEVQGDTTAPTINSINLVENQIVHGVYSIQADVVDSESGVNRVEFYIDDVLKQTASSSPYYYDWDTTQYHSPHVVKIMAYDNAGNSTELTYHVTVMNELPYTGGRNYLLFIVGTIILVFLISIAVFSKNTFIDDKISN